MEPALQSKGIWLLLAQQHLLPWILFLPAAMLISQMIPATYGSILDQLIITDLIMLEIFEDLKVHKVLEDLQDPQDPTAATAPQDPVVQQAHQVRPQHQV